MLFTEDSVYSALTGSPLMVSSAVIYQFLIFHLLTEILFPAHFLFFAGSSGFFSIISSASMLLRKLRRISTKFLRILRKDPDCAAFRRRLFCHAGIRRI